MGSEHVAHNTLERLRSKLLTPEETLAAFAHIDQCGECAIRAGGSIPRAGRAVYAALSTSSVEHLDPESQLFPYVDGVADAADREIVESHIEDCATCRAELADLRTLRQARKRWWPAFAAAAAVAAIAGSALLLTRPKPEPVTPPAVRAITPAQPPAPVISTTTTQELAHWSPEVREALATATLPFPRDLDTLSPSREVLRGDTKQSNAAISPAGIVVRETRPAFSWPAQTGAHYIVTIFRGEREVARSAELTESAWKPEQRLARGETYVWQVEVLHGERIEVLPAPPAPPAMFRIMSGDDAQRIQLAERDHPDDLLLHAVLYAKAGLREEALNALRRSARGGNEDAARLLRDAKQ